MYGEAYIAEKVMDQRVADSRAEVGARNQVRLLKRSQQGWLSRQARALACEAGFLMVRFGVWLENRSLAQVPSLEGRA